MSDPAVPRVRLLTIGREWGRIGCTGFGGPPADIARLRKLCVDERHWQSAREFEDGVAATNLLRVCRSVVEQRRRATALQNGLTCAVTTRFAEVTDVETSRKVLLVGGMVSLTYGFLLGVPLTAIRMRLPHASHHLVTAHLAAIIQGAMLIALTAAAAFSTLPNSLETLAASLLVAGCVLFVAGAVANWLQAVEDHFATRSLGWKLLATSGPLNLIGISLLLAGVLKAL